MSRTLVMGDIHGSFKAMIQCFERSNFNKDIDTLIQLGDVSDGWSEVYECVEELLSVKDLIAIKGNHDDWTADFLNTGLMDPHHRKQGGQGTLDSYLRANQVPATHINFFNNQHLFYLDEAKRLFVHGGFNRHYTLKENKDNDPAIFYWDRDLWMQALSYKELAEMGAKMKFKENLSEIFIGHTATTAWKRDTPMHGSILWNLDTGAGFQGKLTIMDVDTHEYWQSDLVRELYPDEVGRKQFK
jgi:serine/threonine protein phosphatase 1